MTYRNTARAYARASTTGERWLYDAASLDALTRAVPRHRGSGYEPGMKAHAHVAHVENLAAELREALTYNAAVDRGEIPFERTARDKLATAARALLAAIGEGES